MKTKTNTMTLCRLTARDAQHLMMAPHVAGGWIAVAPIVCYAVQSVVGHDTLAVMLALLPSDWSDAHRAVSAPEAEVIAQRLERACSWSSGREAEALEMWAARIREAVRS